MIKKQSFLDSKLKEVGWKGKAEIDVNKLCEGLKKYGYSINELQKNFLIKYANVEFCFSNPKLRGYSINDLY